MAYATDIISETFQKSKTLFYPINKRYWFKMGFVHMFAGNSSSGSGNYNGSGRDYGDVDFKKAITEFNTKALDFISKNGTILGIIIGIIYFFSLIITYINSIFTFVFFDGLLDQSFSIKKSIKATKKLANSLFMFRLIIGLFSLAALAMIFWPVITAFMNNSLINFNLWNFIPMIIGLFAFAVVIGVFMFLVNDFIVPLMYLKKYGFFQAWDYFKKIASKKKMEIFIFWLMKLVLGIAAGVIALIAIIILIIPGIFALLLFGGIGVGIFFGLRLISDIAAISVTAIYATAVFLLLIYLLNVIFVPIPAFFRMYSLEMIKKLEKG